MVVWLKRLVNELFVRNPVDAPLAVPGYNAAAYNRKFGVPIFKI